MLGWRVWPLSWQTITWGTFKQHWPAGLVGSSKSRPIRARHTLLSLSVLSFLWANSFPMSIPAIHPFDFVLPYLHLVFSKDSASLSKQRACLVLLCQASQQQLKKIKDSKYAGCKHTDFFPERTHIRTNKIKQQQKKQLIKKSGNKSVKRYNRLKI